MRNIETPIVHFDFDGTLVKIADRRIQNARKYPLDVVDNSFEFICGLKSAGVEIGSVVSRRPDDVIGQRRRVTRKSIASSGGLHAYFGTPDKVCLEGRVFPWWKSEQQKAKRVVLDALTRVTGMVEDKPHNLGHEMIKIMMAADASQIFEPVVIGVVDHPDAAQRVSKLVDGVRGEFGDAVTVSVEDGSTQFSSHSGGSFLLDVVMLEPFSFAVGVGFGEQLNGYKIK